MNKGRKLRCGDNESSDDVPQLTFTQDIKLTVRSGAHVKSSCRPISLTTTPHPTHVFFPQELNYADLRFLPNKHGGTAQSVSPKHSTEYADVIVMNVPPPAPPAYEAHMQRVRRADP